MESSAKIFSEIITEFSYKGKSKASLCNMTFFLGAGFSKSWDDRFPVGNQLFTLKFDDWERKSQFLESYLRTHGYDVLEDITPSRFKEIIYQLGMYKKYPEIRPRYIDDGNIHMVESELRALVLDRFKTIAPLYYYNEGTQKIDFGHDLNDAQRSIVDLFYILMRESDGSQGVSEGLRTHILTTNYDFIPEAILDSILAPDDSFLLYTYRGVTPYSICGNENPVAVHDNWLVNSLFKINGGFEVFQKNGQFEFDYRNHDFEHFRANPPQIMLPSNEQDYTQDYFKALFPKSIRLLQESRVLVVVGYSLPEEDALIRFLMKQFAEDRADGDNKIIFYIDISSDEEQISKISSVFPHSDEQRGLTVVPFSGGFGEWVKTVLDIHLTKQSR
ncbi:hypothetical protein [Vibrio crassostreae]|uniref:hypothetical protein n=1 Tax=Vibrio crassostreae TaxID=246167 RepID=UPI00105000B3|nr:hypothetical protein [Vibrio crassostreae]TCV31996.1 hypothetical protein EDB71_101508 [Vibrio crassostreae]